MANSSHQTLMQTDSGPDTKTEAGLMASAAEASGRAPQLVLWLGAAGWLAAASVLQLLSSVQLHAPGFLADAEWLTHGRMQIAGAQAWIYGFGLPAGLGAALWLLARLGRVRLEWPAVATAGTVLWNIAVAIGVFRILAGEGTGCEGFEFPADAALLLVVAYGLVGVSALETFRCRREESLHPSQWCLLAALFWYPWVCSTAALMLWVMPARGILQAAVAWWYVGNLVHVWFTLVGLAVLLYLVPAFTNRPLQGLGHVRMAFWLLVVLGGWRGIPPQAPLPAWMPAVSTVASVLSLVPLLAVTIALWRTVVGGGRRGATGTPEETERGGSMNPPAHSGIPLRTKGRATSPGAPQDTASEQSSRAGLRIAPKTSASETACGGALGEVALPHTSWRVRGCALGRSRGTGCLVVVATIAYVAAGLLSIAAAVPEVNRLTAFTLFERGWTRLFLGGFFGLTAFAAMYVVWPRLLVDGLPSLPLVRIHLWGTVLGVAFQAVPLLVGGIAQGLLMNDPQTAFLDALQPGLMALRISTLGDVMVTAASGALAANLVWGLGRWGWRVGQGVLAEALRPEDAEVGR